MTTEKLCIRCNRRPSEPPKAICSTCKTDLDNNYEKANRAVRMDAARKARDKHQRNNQRKEDKRYGE